MTHNAYKDAAALLGLSARTARQAYDIVRKLDPPFAEDLAGTVFAGEAFEIAWKKNHAKQLCQSINTGT